MLTYQTSQPMEGGIAIVGIGGAGAHILQCFAGSSANNVRLYTLSPDERVGFTCGSNVEYVPLGSGMSHGLSCGGDPTVGARAARESRAELQAMLKDARLLVMVAGLGGGTGSGVTPVLAQMAREAGLFLVSVLVMPFSFEGERRRTQAEAALEEISRLSDIVFCFENDYMEELFRNRSGARAVFEEVDRLLARATAAVPMLASSPGFINLGLDELAVALENNDSRCIFGTGSGYGPDRATSAARAVLESPLVAHRNALSFARTVIVHVAGGDSMSITEIRTVMETVRDGLADKDVNIFFGTTVKPHLADEIRVTLIASVDSKEFHAAIAAADEAAAAAVAETEDETPEATEEPENTPAEEPAAPEQEPVAVEPTPEPVEEEEAEDEPAPEAEEEPAEVEEEAEDAVPSFTVQPAMHQPELMPATVGTLGTAADGEDEPAAPQTGNLFAEGDGSFVRFSRRGADADDDLDTPPSVNFNSLRGIFPRN
ncbi:MAG: hypothetical protein IJ943_05275 [Akkermansia sp.]|nr:hypothetical protein [Akkermansia sp.]